MKDPETSCPSCGIQLIRKENNGRIYSSFDTHEAQCSCGTKLVIEKHTSYTIRYKNPPKFGDDKDE
jgi:hypothetical protein